MTKRDKKLAKLIDKIKKLDSKYVGWDLEGGIRAALGPQPIAPVPEAVPDITNLLSGTLMWMEYLEGIAARFIRLCEYEQEVHVMAMNVCGGVWIAGQENSEQRIKVRDMFGINSLVTRIREILA